MEVNQHIQGVIEKDAAATEILGKYAIWHPGIKAEELCSPCEHCSGGEDCHPCGASE